MNTFHFLKNLVQHGWIAHMSELQLKVLLAYASHADESGKAFPSSRTIARYNQMSEKSAPNVRAARAWLVRRGWLKRLPTEQGPRGRSVNPYLITLPTGQAPAVTRKCATRESAAGTRTQRRDRVAVGTTVAPVAEPATPRCSPNDDGTPLPNPHTEESQGRESGKMNIASEFDLEVEAIYQAYPRRAAKAKALTAIRQAIERIDGKTGAISPTRWLLERVRVYCAWRDRVVAGDRTQATYTPNPATWFDDESYKNDECRPVAAPSARPGGERPWSGKINNNHGRQPRRGIIRHGQEDR